MIKGIKNQNNEKTQKRVAELRSKLEASVTVRTDLSEQEKQERFADLQKRVQETSRKATGLIASALKTKKKGEKLVKKLNNQNEKALKKITKAQSKFLDPILESRNLF